MSGAEIVFWASTGLVVYVYFGYPAVLGVLGRLIRRAPKARPVEPSVSLLVAAYNEADVIQDKVRNGLAQDYPAEKLEIVVASDGSTDGTAELARRATADGRVRVFDYPRNRGKITVLNETLPELRGEIVAFSDASSMLAPDAIRRLVESFADSEVGAVSGVYKVRKKNQAQLGVQEDFYWKYETWLKIAESRISSTLGAHGSLYAIRRKLYPFPAPGTINDDYIIPLRILQRGWRMAYEPRAVAYEEAHEMGGFGRRVRIMAGNLQQLREIGPLLWPPRWMPLFFFLSHKAGRLMVPFCMLAALVSSVALAARPTYAAAAVLQTGFYLLALAGALVELHPRVLRLPYYFCMINAAIFSALARMAAAPHRLTWKH